MADEWKAPESEPEEREERKSWKLLEKTLLAGVQEQRRARRWGIFFKLLTFVYLFGLLALFLHAYALTVPLPDGGELKLEAPVDEVWAKTVERLSAS